MFNGSFTKNFKVIDVQIFQQTIVNNDSTLILHFDDNLKAGMDANDGRQFGWASIDALAQDWSYVDPDHVIVNDLFISAQGVNPGVLNYVIKLERITTSLNEAILDEVKNKQQA